MHALLHAYIRIFAIACMYKCSIFTRLTALANTHGFRGSFRNVFGRLLWASARVVQFL